MRLPGILNDPFCCTTLLAIERSLLQQTRRRRYCTFYVFPQNWPFSLGDWVLPLHLTHGTYGLPKSSSQMIGSAVFVWVPNAMLYNALSVGKKTLKTAPSPWDFVTLPEEDRATAIGNIHRKIGKNHACGSRDILVDRQTDRHTETCSSQYFATTSTGKVTINFLSECVTHFTSTWLCSNMQLACCQEYSQNSNTCTFTSLSSCEMSAWAYDYCTLGTTAGPQ